jgi:hypothetical protein
MYKITPIELMSAIWPSIVIFLILVGFFITGSPLIIYSLLSAL